MEEDTNKTKLTPLQIALICIIVISLAYIVTYWILDNRRLQRESRPTPTLRTIGSSQLAYQGAYKPFRNFPGYDALKVMIEAADERDMSTDGEYFRYTLETSPSGEKVGYAWPLDTSVSYLKTFSLAPDDITRVYNPDEGDVLMDYTTWDPIL